MPSWLQDQRVCCCGGAAFYQSQAAVTIALDCWPWSTATAGVAAETAPTASSRPAVMPAIFLKMSFPFDVSGNPSSIVPPTLQEFRVTLHAVQSIWGQHHDMPLSGRIPASLNVLTPGRNRGFPPDSRIFQHEYDLSMTTTVGWHIPDMAKSYLPRIMLEGAPDVERDSL